ncbi:hypothetical protein T440DRAFT_492948 [Plenodomus tracheiphilus IPT5]|uniref:Protein SQS1 n=1 Tax=Plenodomus tracheiphilus IPT5 TaxID=1408161 RepID=A0A6A7AUF2_9PLEO|nr:hypothetical protein T440DRAFT_492948 [Plenodomus tracheiphilus IPT5]
MSRKKGKSKAKGSAKSTPHRAPANRHSSQPWPAQEAWAMLTIAAAMAPKLSLTEEARWMSSHRTAAYEAGKKLRHMPIQFISAGRLEGTIKERPPVVVDAADSESNDDSVAASSSSAPPDNTAAMAHLALRDPSPALSESSSSGDEVVFRGRGQEQLVPVATSHSATKSSQTRPNFNVPGDDIRPSATHSTSTLAVASAAAQTSVSPQVENQASAELSTRIKAFAQANDDLVSDSDGIVQDQFERRRGGRPAWEGTTTEWQHGSKPNVGWLPIRDRPDMDAFLHGDTNPRDAALDDYMQNMDEFGLTADVMAASGFARREMDLDAGSHNDWESASDSQDGEGDGEDEADTPEEPHDSWDSDMLHDLADLSTSSDVMDAVVRILAKRTRKSGLQYLCVYEGHVTDDACWLPCTFLRTAAEKQLLRAFEEEADLREQQQSSSSDSADEDKDTDDDDDDEEFDDETIARVLQKQEELGLGSDEMLLYAGDEVFDAPVSYRVSSFGSPPRSKKQRESRGRGNRDPAFPSASALADALAMDPYGGFDIMDTERPSLRVKKKGRRGQMPPELEDPDLNDQLQNAWENDRAKKRLKKAEREELRQQGLLGRKGKGPNLKVKYQGGVAMEDVVEEIREFMMGDMQTLSLPPMDAHRRATVHQAASFFNLSSRSRGDGQNRFTVLSKTTRTRSYTDDEFDIAIQHKGFLKRLQGPLHSQGGMRKGGTFRTGARNKPQTGYKDGETVGADAPALGPENRGHALLSKMGWSKGMGLGALDNKGILQPISHTVKINKAGLQ